MRQKRNAKTTIAIIADDARARALVSLALEATIQPHEVDEARSATMDHTLEHSATLLDQLKRILGS